MAKRHRSRAENRIESALSLGVPAQEKINLIPLRGKGMANWDPLDHEDTRRSGGGGGHGGSASRYQHHDQQKNDTRYVKNIKPQSPGQEALWKAIHAHNLTLALGPAGTGKTFLAISAAVEALDAGKVDRLILSRPAVEAGESLGYLPGDIGEKMSPFLRPLLDALVDRMGAKRLKALMAEGVVEIAPVAYMRGRTLNNAFVVIDEAQNCTYTQIKMLLTRLGWHSTMILTGDPDQSDLLPGISGLRDVATRLEKVEGIGVVRLADRDIIRHPLVASMLGVL